MRAAQITVVLAAASASGSQIVNLDLPAVVRQAGTILVARIDSIEETGCCCQPERSFEITVVGPVEGWSAPGTVLTCIYSQEMPEVRLDESGCEVTEWPLVTGSGIEFLVEPCDRVVILLRAGQLDPAVHQEILRMEPLDSLAAVIDLIVETSGEP